ncbi:hypothetical protein LguiB_020653 [Lonicera macranthoides]
MAYQVVCLLIYSSFFLKRALSEPRATETTLICGNASAANSDRQVFIANFVAAMDSVTSLVSSQRFGSAINGFGNTTVYVFGECMRDLSRNDCDVCFAQCKIQILRCKPFQRLIRGGRFFNDACYLRYDDYMFFNESLSPVDRTVCSANDFVGNQSLFGANVVKLVRKLRVEAPRNDGFFVGSVGRGKLMVYGLAQCWKFVNGSACVRCMENSLSKIGSCPPKEEGRVLNSGCYLRYSLHKFYNNSDPDATGRGNGRRVILVATYGSGAFVLFVATALFFIRKKFEKQRREKKQLGALLITANKSKINFSYETLERATNYFHDTNKLGRGASGSVYKGTLPDGKIVAVKRLLFNTSHITGPESLLVYEYVQNRSLHDHLFGKKNENHQLLSWEVRHKIILGTAEGLAYLHEYSKFRIIHRDIKLSNVLLDDDFTPKIADFGLVRLFPENKTHISTAIAGTPGYMAPEYVVRGKLTQKADVYSFGVLVIEVLCGKRNTAFSENSFSILQKVWNLYGSGRSSDAIDPKLEGNFQENEASRLLQIGLLCAQASAKLRPSMANVVKMLVHKHEIPKPEQPPFLKSSSGEISLFNEPCTYYSQRNANAQSSRNSITQSWTGPR